jgi:hypothetical protein
MCTVFGRGVCVLRDSKDMTTFSINKQTGNISLTLIEEVSIGGGERGKLYLSAYTPQDRKRQGVGLHVKSGTDEGRG